MSAAGLDALRARVYADPELAHRLRELEPERLNVEVLRLAAQHGADVTHRDLVEAAASARREWMLRWVR